MTNADDSHQVAANYTQSLDVSCSVDVAFSAVTDGITRWWSDVVAGGCAKGQTMAVVFGTSAKLLKTVEREDNRRLVWRCETVLMADPDAHYPEEWTGTEMIWAFSRKNNGAQVTLIHRGLTPKLACYETCEKAWNFFFLDSLKSYLETGKGDPHLNCS